MSAVTEWAEDLHGWRWGKLAREVYTGTESQTWFRVTEEREEGRELERDRGICPFRMCSWETASCILEMLVGWQREHRGWACEKSKVGRFSRRPWKPCEGFRSLHQLGDGRPFWDINKAVTRIDSYLRNIILVEVWSEVRKKENGSQGDHWGAVIVI